MPTVRKTVKATRRASAKQRARLEAMSDAEITAAAKADPDNPPLATAELTRARGAQAPKGRGGRPQKTEAERKRLITLRLPADVLEHFRSTGPGWQTRIGETLERAVATAARKLGKAKRKPRPVDAGQPRKAKRK